MDVEVIRYEMKQFLAESIRAPLLVHSKSVAVRTNSWMVPELLRDDCSKRMSPMMIRMQIRVVPSPNWNWWLQCRVSGLFADWGWNSKLWQTSEAVLCNHIIYHFCICIFALAWRTTMVEMRYLELNAWT